MEKYVAYNQKEVKDNIDDSYRRLKNVAGNLAVVAHQLDGKRNNLNSSYIKGIMNEINGIVENLWRFEFDNHHNPKFSLHKELEKLEESIKKTESNYFPPNNC